MEQVRHRGSKKQNNKPHKGVTEGFFVILQSLHPNIRKIITISVFSGVHLFRIITGLLYSLKLPAVLNRISGDGVLCVC